jgi:voltage-gated sodium channel
MSEQASVNDRLREELNKFCNEKLFPNLLREIGTQVRSDLSEEFQRFRMELQYSLGRNGNCSNSRPLGMECDRSYPDGCDSRSLGMASERLQPKKTDHQLHVPVLQAASVTTDHKDDSVSAFMSRDDESPDGTPRQSSKGVMIKESGPGREYSGNRGEDDRLASKLRVPKMMDYGDTVGPEFGSSSTHSPLKKREKRLSRIRRSMEGVDCTATGEEGQGDDGGQHDLFGRAMMGYVVAKEIDVAEMEEAEASGHYFRLKSECSCYRNYRDRALPILTHPYFDYCVSSIIVANAILIGVQTDIAATQREAEQTVGMRALDLFFCAVFTVELGFRLSVYHVRFFCSSAWKWNVFDFVVVFVQLVEEVAAAVMGSQGGGGTGLDFSFMRVLRVLRMIRVLRLVRIMRMIGELRMLVASISNSLRSLMWTIALLSLCIYIVAVYFTAMIADHPNGDMESVEEVWGNIFLSMLTLFECITGGMDWHDALAPMMHNISYLMALPFILYICFSILAMMNVITGVFVESALASAKEDQDVFMVNNVRDMLKQDGDQPMTWQMFSNFLDKPAMLEYFKNIDVDVSEARGLFMLLDMNDSGTLDTEEFLNGCIRLRGIAKSLDLALLTRQVKHMFGSLSEQMGTMEHRMGLLCAADDNLINHSKTMHYRMDRMQTALSPPQSHFDHLRGSSGQAPRTSPQSKALESGAIPGHIGFEPLPPIAGSPRSPRGGSKKSLSPRSPRSHVTPSPRVGASVRGNVAEKAKEKLNGSNWSPPDPAPPIDFYPPALNVVMMPESKGYPFYDEC